MITLLEKLGVKTILPSGENVQIGCPFAPYTTKHRSSVDGKPSMGILVRDDDTCLVNCFTCDYRFGSLVHMFQKLAEFNADWEPLVEEAQKIEDVDIDILLGGMSGYRVWGAEQPDETIDPSEWKPYANLFHGYWTLRGIKKEVAKAWGVGFDRVRKRVVIPVRNKDSDLVGAVGRTITTEGKPKYLNYWNFDKGKYLLGEHMVERNTAVILCEGALDAMMLYQHLDELDLLDEYSVVASLGAKLTKKQMNRLVQLTNEVVVAFDNDDAGRSGTQQVAKLIGKRVVCKRLPYTGLQSDPGSLSVDEFEELLAGSRLLF